MVLKFNGKFGTLGDILAFIKSYIDSRNLDGKEIFNKMVEFSKSSQANEGVVLNALCNYSTVDFRDFCKIHLGYDYWVEGSMEKMLFNHNSINEIDSAMAYYKHTRFNVNVYISKLIKESGETEFINERNNNDLLDKLSKGLTDQFIEQFEGECWVLYFNDMVKEWFDAKYQIVA
ncbi:MAG: hypothetical protein QM504_10305 [Pseudomonadota bacterium]